MKGFILKYIIVFLLVILSGGLLMDVSHRVQSVERDVNRYGRDIAREAEAIRVLKAEWAYLNDPARLENLAAGGLDLMPPEAVKLVSDMSDDDDKIKSYVAVPAKSPLRIDISYAPRVNDNIPSPMPPQANSSILINTTTIPNNDGGAQ